ncbi:hypothetical protein CRG98_034345 [Punica granatum]|uniref:Uncharacterized protein n=1 Tax=Punica granatum TaxID=22663 RepID=A0A2I0IMN8_PUNGR|nr:hypothetical protein CRG98_034345 [Punica granatum]
MAEIEAPIPWNWENHQTGDFSDSGEWSHDLGHDLPIEIIGAVPPIGIVGTLLLIGIAKVLCGFDSIQIDGKFIDVLELLSNRKFVQKVHAVIVNL